MAKTKAIEVDNSKQARCKFCHPDFRKDGITFNCIADGWDDDKIKAVSEKVCEKCDRFKSRYIEYPLTINGIENREIDTTGLGHKTGCLCEVKPCGDEYEEKSYLGFYLGDLPLSIYSSYNEKTGILTNSTMTNPAIFVPELGKIIYGCESWWREIKSTEDFKGISQGEIENTWYVQLAKAMCEKD